MVPDGEDEEGKGAGMQGKTLRVVHSREKCLLHSASALWGQNGVSPWVLYPRAISLYPPAGKVSLFPVSWKALWRRGGTVT